MRLPAKPPDRNDRFLRPVKSRQGSAIQAHAGNRLARPTQTRAITALNTRVQAAAGGPTIRTAAPLRGGGPPAGPNRSVGVVNRQAPGRPTSLAASRGTQYTVQAPIHMGGSQQIRATIQGTPQVAGSVEISAAGSGKAYISNLKVDQQHRRQGVAAKLIDAAIANARRQGFSAASLEARPSDNGITPQTLVAMYRRQGFKSVGRSSRGSPLMERKL